MKFSNIGTVFAFLCVGLFFGKAQSNIVLHCDSKDECKKCHEVLRNCFLSEADDVFDCAIDAAERDGSAPCVQRDSSYVHNKHVAEAFIEMEPEDLNDEAKHFHLIEEIVNKASDECTNKKKSLSPNEEHLTDELKKKLITLCNYANYEDNYVTAKRHVQATPEEIYEHVKSAYMKFTEEPNKMEYLKNILSNAAMCLKNPQEWIADRTGLEMPKNLPSVGLLTVDNLRDFSRKLHLRTFRNAP